MDRLIRTVLSFKEMKIRHDDDFADRLSRQYTCSLLIVFALIVSTKQFVGEPIACWCPAHFTDSHRSYANTMCWISNTFYVPFDQRIPENLDSHWRERKMVSYYQWVPLIMLSMSLLAFMPCLVWRFLNMRSGIDVTGLLDSAEVCQKASYAEIRHKTIRYIVNQIDRYLLMQRDYSAGCCMTFNQTLAKHCFLFGGKRHGNYLMVTYLIIKLLYLANAVGQLFLLDHFLGMHDFHMYGAQVVARVMQGEDWTVSERFPRVTLCSFSIRHQARIHDYVVQCALTINLFNEKIFIIIWFWYVFVAIMTFISCITWIIRALYWPAQIHYAKKKLRAYEVTHRSKANLRKFVQYYLRRDGLFILRLLSINIGELVAAETLAALWENYGPDKRMISEHPAAKLKRPPATAPSNGQHTGSMDVV